MILFTLLFLSIFVCYLYLRNILNYWKNKNVPYLKPNILIGNFKDVLLKRKGIGHFIEDMHNKTKEKFVGIWIFTSPNLIIRCPELIKDILIKDFDYFADRIILSDEKADPILSQTLFSVKNPKWKWIRKKMSTCFSSSKIKSMTVLIDHVGKNMTKSIAGMGGNYVVDCKEFCRKFGVDSIATCAFGLDAKSFEDDNAPFLQTSLKVFEVNFMCYIRMITNLVTPSIAKLLRISFLDPAPIEFLKNAFNNAMQERESSKLFRNDVMDTLIHLRNTNGKNFDGNFLAAQPIQIFIAGFETTNSTISFALYELCQHDVIQTKLRDEIRKAFKTYGSFTYEALGSMKYMDKVVLETLRKYPILPFLDRRCLKDYKIPNSDVIIEKGTPILISVLGLHYDPQYYPNPQIFDPERFSDENLDSRPSSVFLSFGLGPRHCIGERMGFLAAKMALAHILMEFRVEKCEETPVTVEYNPSFNLLVPQNGLPLRIIHLHE